MKMKNIPYNRHCDEPQATRQSIVERFATVPMAISLLMFAAPAFASGNYTTPEYSGPGARIDGGGMGNTEPMVTRTPSIGPSSPDYGFDAHIEDRGARISDEMDRRRDEAVRIKEEHILKTNE